MGVTGRYVDPNEEHRRGIAELTVRARPTNVVPIRNSVTRLSPDPFSREAASPN